MFKPASIFIGWRYVRAAQAERTITLYALISILGMALGVAVLIIVLSLLNGFEREFKSRILGLVAPIKVYAEGDWSQWQEQLHTLSENPDWEGSIRGYAPFIEMPGMLVGGGETETVYLAGIDPEFEQNLSPMSRSLFDTYSISELMVRHPKGVILGKSLATELGLSAGDSVKLLLALPEAAGDVARVLPKSIILTVAGIIHTKTELDRRLALIHLSYAQELLKMKGVMGVKLGLHDVMSATRAAGQLRYDFKQLNTGQRYWVVDWVQTHGNLFEAIQLPQTIMRILLFFVLLVAAFNMTTTLFMMVRQKRKELAVMQTIGATTRQITGGFLAQGMIVAMIGILLGIAFGLVVANALPIVVNMIERLSGEVLFQGDSYFIQFLPVEVIFSDVLMIGITALLVSVMAVIFPAFRASKLDPVQALRGDD